MGLLDRFRFRKKLKAARALVEAGQGAEAFHVLSGSGAGCPPALLVELAEWLIDAEYYPEAARAIELVLARASDDWVARVLQAEIKIHEGRAEEAVRIYRNLLVRKPRHRSVTRQLTVLLLERGEARQVVDLLAPFLPPTEHWVAVSLGRAHLLLGEAPRAVELLEAVYLELEAQLKRLDSAVVWEQLKQEFDEVSVFYSEAVVKAHGREALTERLLVHKQLDARAGVNYRLIGQRLMIDSPRLAVQSRLQVVSEMEEQARQLLRQDKRDRRGWLLEATAHLRQGRLAKARERFEALCDADQKNFAAFLGLGAAMDAERFGHFRLAERLPALSEPASLEQIAPDIPCLTGLERRVVVASVYPLRGALPALAAARCVIRVLPIDVRAVDLDEFARLAAERDEDERSYSAATGIAGQRLAIAKIEDLLELSGEGALTFAHEFAHLVYFHCEQELGERVEALFVRAAELGFVGGAYQMKNIDEFFAVAYTDFLRSCYKLEMAREMDEARVMVELFRMFEELAAQEHWGVTAPA
jgi:tetratricopeptide (TPR) repeat protein